MCILVGDLGVAKRAKDVYYKQMHRMIWERRHGKVGTGEKSPKQEYALDNCGMENHSHD